MKMNKNNIYNKIVNVLFNHDDFIYYKNGQNESQNVNYNGFCQTDMMSGLFNIIKQVNYAIFSVENDQSSINGAIEVLENNFHLQMLFKELNIDFNNLSNSILKFKSGEFTSSRSIEKIIDKLEPTQFYFNDNLFKNIEHSKLVQNIVNHVNLSETSHSDIYFEIGYHINIPIVFSFVNQLTLLITLPHINNDKLGSNLIEHYESIDKLNRESPIQTPIKFSKFLSNNLNLSNQDIRRLSNIHKFQNNELKLQFVENHDYENWLHIYQKILSCMSTDNNVIERVLCYCTSSDYWKNDNNLNNDNNGLRLAYFGSLDNPEARAIVNENNKSFYKVYGDLILDDLLQKEGYVKDANYLNNVVIATKKIEYDYKETLLTPYIDGDCSYANQINDNMLILSNDKNARFVLKDAHAPLDRHYEYECQCCLSTNEFDDIQAHQLFDINEGGQYEPCDNEFLCQDCVDSGYLLAQNDYVLIKDKNGDFYSRWDLYEDSLMLCKVAKECSDIYDEENIDIYYNSLDNLEHFNIIKSDITNYHYYGDDLIEINGYFVEKCFIDYLDKLDSIDEIKFEIETLLDDLQLFECEPQQIIDNLNMIFNNCQSSIIHTNSFKI